MSHLKCVKHDRRVFISPASKVVYHRGVDKQIKHTVCDSEYVEIDGITYTPEEMTEPKKAFVLPK